MFWINVGLWIGMWIFGYLLGRTIKIGHYEDKLRGLEGTKGDLLRQIDLINKNRNALTEEVNRQRAAFAVPELNKNDNK